MEYQKIHNINFKISKKTLLEKIVDANGKPKRISKRLESSIQKAVDEINNHAQAQAVYAVVPVNREGKAVHLSDGPPLASKRVGYVLKPCDKAVAFLVTLGGKIDKLIQQETEDRPHYGYVLDAAASIATEAVAQQVQEYVEKKLSDDIGTTYRYSPGYCDWPLEEQKTLCQVLPYESIGVELDKNLLMTPQKSISGIFGICPAKTAKTNGNACTICGKKDCPYRREEVH